MNRPLRILAGCLALLPAAAAIESPAAAPERWGLWETTFAGPRDGNPFLDVRLTATFVQGATRIAVSGFWDGAGDYRVRFSPPTEGAWRYETHSNRPELDGRTGELTAAAPSPANHGPVQAFKTHHLRFADGTPYHQFGTTCYAWTHQPEALQEQTLKTLAASPFNKIRFCVFPKSYAYSKNEPELFAFRKGADGTFDFAQPDPAFWRHFERRIRDLQRLGVEADLILWHPYDRWGFSEMSKEEDDRYLRYCIARLSAFRNVWWSLANEFDLMAPKAMKGHRGNKEMADWDRFFQILQKEDPHQRLRSIHNCRGFYDYTRPWVTHASIQTSDMNKGVTFRAQFNKPVVYDECKYEGNVPQGWGNLDAKTMTQRFWLGTLSGCTVGHGETYLHPEDILWWSKGGVLHGESPARIQWLKDFMAKAPPFDELKPLGDDQGRFLLAKPGEYYLLGALNTQPQSIGLAGNRPYKVDRIDPWEMTVTPLGSTPAGEVSFKPPKSDQAYRFTPYAPGERLRPEARIEASVTEGLLPLSVRFSTAGGVKARWAFGDGAASEASAPEHVYTRAGVYTVTLTVTDAAGGCAQSSCEVLVEDTVIKPLVRAGCAGETPELALGGTAKRTADGTLLFPDGAPWGWASGRRHDPLRGLRAFTVTGWLKPASLATGRGGNRILFCLNRDTDGIDLVCHSDGRMRLAVNQWPDKVNNDSASGKLTPGKWTFFAVTYDSTLPRDNVRWFFSAPLDAPDAAAKVAPDRTNTYAAGPVGADIGSLAVGNFNETMRGAGLDRQFRGEIRNLQVHGSRVGNAGALDLPSIHANAEKIRVILDTDANNELDDQHAIAYLLFNGDVFDVEGITVNRTSEGGPIEAHVAEANRVVELCGLKGKLPVLAGASGTFGEINGQLAKADFDGHEAVDFIIRQAHAADPRKLVLLPVGKLTNIALALAKDPSIAAKVRIVWLGSNFPAPGEYNQVNDEPSVSALLDTGVPFEIALVRYGKPSGTDAVRATLEEIRQVMPGKGPHASTPVAGRHGGSFTCFGDYSLNLFEHIKLNGNPPSRALFDMAAVAIVKNPGWAKAVTIPAPFLKDKQWVDRPDNARKIVLWENFDRDAIMRDFYARMKDYRLAGSE